MKEQLMRGAVGPIEVIADCEDNISSSPVRTDDVDDIGLIYCHCALILTLAPYWEHPGDQGKPPAEQL